MFHIIDKNKMKLIIAGCGHGKDPGTTNCTTDPETGIETCTTVPPKKPCKTHKSSLFIL